MQYALALLSTLVLVGCDNKNLTEGCDASADTDADGLDDCAEEKLGTNPDVADSDGDGLTDSEEIDCVSDPLDSEELCYACGWPHGDPDTLSATGNEEGDTIANLGLIDQCGEDVSLWDFAGSYRILFMTTYWCGVCRNEAEEIPERTADFLEEGLVEDFSYILILSEDYNGNAPTMDEAALYDEQIEASGFAVTANPAQDVITETPWDGYHLPGKCVLSPEMELLHCYDGEDDTEGFEAIRDHVSAR